MKTIKQLFNKLLNHEQTTKEKDTYYFRVYRWQARLPMTAYEKLVYAFIYGYNQQNKGFCYLNTQLGGGVFGISAETIDAIVGKMLDKGWLFKDSQGLLWCDKFKTKQTKKLLKL
jgi:hypothetical protein